LFALKRLLGEFLNPLHAWVAISFLGIILCVWKPKHLAGTVLLLAGTAWLVIASLPVTGFFLLECIEARAGTVPDLRAPGYQGIRYVVVLGNVAEGVRLWRLLPGSTLVISSGSYTRVMVERAQAMGVPLASVITESEGRDTQEQAVRLKALLMRERFILSTWALHMQRTLLIFRRQGLDPVPAPTDFLSRAKPSAGLFLPSASGMSLTRLALHELVGTLWLLLNPSCEDAQADSLSRRFCRRGEVSGEGLYPQTSMPPGGTTTHGPPRACNGQGYSTAGESRQEWSFVGKSPINPFPCTKKGLPGPFHMGT
jgi:uncharacterized SAM-binding protein YcdF (DUF218 family)